MVFDPYPISGLGVAANAALALPELSTAAPAGTVDAVFELIGATGPAMVIAHAEAPEAMRLATRLGERHPEVPLLVLLSGAAGADTLRALRAAGVRGLLPSDVTAAELRVAMARTCFRRGHHYPGSPEELTAAGPGRRPLSAREHTVLVLVAEGMTNDAIARQLYLSTDTVRCHVRSVLSKLAAHNRTHAVALGYRLGLLPCEPEPATVSTAATVADTAEDVPLHA